jgi:hypothetical protein
MIKRSVVCFGSLLATATAVADDLAPAPATPPVVASATAPGAAPAAPGGAAPAIAQPPGVLDVAPPAAAAPDLPTVAITISPVHLGVPMAEVTTEVRVADKLGIAAILGVGSFRDKATDMTVNLFEGGVSARYYVLGTFRKGLQLGAEALYLKADTDASNIDVKAAGLSLAPFVGYKWTHSTGFTFDGQLGAAFVVARAKAETGQMAGDSRIGPLLNLNLGYSF